jgi:uncharacterized protein YidB (DUF937 family)
LSFTSYRRESVYFIFRIILSSSFLLSIPHAQAVSVSDPPTGLSAIPISPTSISLFWSKPQNNGGSPITGYKIEYKTPTLDYTTLSTLGNFTNYNSTGMVTSKTYIFRVSAINSVGTSDPSNEAVATPASNSKPLQNVPPNPPIGLVATSSLITQIDLSWNPPSSNAGPPVTGYKIQFSVDSGSYSDLIANSGSTLTSYSHTGVSSSHTYSYKVFAINSVGTSNSSNTISAVPTQVNSAPLPPTSLSTTATSTTSISLSWNSPASNGGSIISGYKIEAKIGSGAYTILVANTASSSTHYLNSGLIEGTTYTYRVSAINSIGTSSPSNEASATPTKTFVPTGLIATAVSPTEIDLSWVVPSETYGQSIGAYRIDQKFSSGTFDTIVDNTGMTTSYAIKNLQTGKTYTFVIIALFTNGGESNPSQEVSATPTNNLKPPATPPVSTLPSTPPTNLPSNSTPQPLTPNSPTGLSITKTSSSSVRISWISPPKNDKFPITGYKIESKIGSGSYSILATNVGTETSYLHTGLVPNTYTYRVSAINSVGTGSPSTDASITLAISTPTPSVIESYGGIQSVTGTDYSVGYNIVGGKISGMTINQNTFSLHVQLDSKNGGSLSLNLPRELIDAKKIDGSDDTYLVSEGKQILNFTETRDDNVRNLVINYPAGTSDLSIYGTHVIPEFPIAIIILVIGFATVIFFSRKIIKVQSSLL